MHIFALLSYSFDKLYNFYAHLLDSYTLFLHNQDAPSINLAFSNVPLFAIFSKALNLFFINSFSSVNYLLYLSASLSANKSFAPNAA